MHSLSLFAASKLKKKLNALNILIHKNCNWLAVICHFRSFFVDFYSYLVLAGHILQGVVFARLGITCSSPLEWTFFLLHLIKTQDKFQVTADSFSAREELERHFEEEHRGRGSFADVDHIIFNYSEYELYSRNFFHIQD